jgi:RNA polymerase sigma-54 factor
MISNSLTTKLQQKFSASQIQFMKLLQLPMQSLEGRIKEELEKNPVLEEENTKDNDDNIDVNQQEESEEGRDVDENEMDIYFQDDDIPDYRGKGEQKQELGSYYSSEKTLYEDLLNQLSLEDISKREEIIGKEIIGNINDSGYLTRSIDAIVDDLLFSQNIEVNKKEIEKVLSIIQTFDPAGVGATSLSECLLLQLDRYKGQGNDISISKQILETESLFSMFKNKQYQQLLLKLECTKDELEKAIHQIKKLNPKPANSNEGIVGNVYITPDFFLWNNNGKVEFQLNKTFEHSLRISTYYSSMLEKMKKNKDSADNKQAISFIKEKMESASDFIVALSKRDETLNKVMKAIIKFQYQYFLEGDVGKLKPMRLIDIATMTDNDVSTISRVASNKYCQTHFGLFLLKDFFSNAVEDKKGNKVSSDTIKAILMQHINNEDKKKPLTDDALVEIMKKEGYSLARRTIAKYRDNLNIPVARLRKTLS